MSWIQHFAGINRLFGFCYELGYEDGKHGENWNQVEIIYLNKDWKSTVLSHNRQQKLKINAATNQLALNTTTELTLYGDGDLVEVDVCFA